MARKKNLRCQFKLKWQHRASWYFFLADFAGPIPELAPLYHLPFPLPTANINPFWITYIVPPATVCLKMLENSGMMDMLSSLPQQAAGDVDSLPQERSSLFASKGLIKLFKKTFSCGS